MRGRARNTSVLGALCAGCLLAAHASASPAPTLFRLTITGTANAQWDHTGPAVASGTCQRMLESQGTRVVRFRSSRPAVVRVSGGRVLPTRIRGLTGTVTLTGPNTIKETCGGVETDTPQPCAPTTRTFTDARTTVSSPRPGTLTLRPLRVTLSPSSCPDEPDDIVAAPLGQVPGPEHLTVTGLLKKRTTHLRVSASGSRRKVYARPEQGTLEQHAVWTLTFTRVRP